MVDDPLLKRLHSSINPQVSTVDGFQGREVDIVLFSCVRAPSANSGGGGGGIGFLSDRRRMNVAITRARRSLVVLGNARRLASDATWRALVDDAAHRDRLVPDVVRGARCSIGGDGDGVAVGEALCGRLEAMSEEAASEHEAGRCHGNPWAKKEGNDDKDSRSRGHGLERREENGEDAAVSAGDAADKLQTRWRKVSVDRREDCDPASSPQEERQGAIRRRVAPAGEAETVKSSGGSNTVASGSRRDGRGTCAGKERPTPAALGVSAVSGDDHSMSRGDKRPRDEHGSGSAVLELADKRTARDTLTEDTRTRSNTFIPVEPRREPSAASSSSGSNSGRDRGGGGGGNSMPHPAKRGREAAPGCSIRAISGDDRNRGNHPTPPVMVDGAPTGEGGGFLGGLLSSLHSNAGGIASGREHSFRQGLRGGRVRGDVDIMGSSNEHRGNVRSRGGEAAGVQ